MERNKAGEILLRLATVHSPPYVYLNEGPDGVFQAGGGFGELNNEMSKRLNISYIIHHPASGGFGTLLPNGTATGMAGMVFRKEADLILAAYSLNYQTSQVVEYLPIIIDNPVTILSSSEASQGTVDFTSTIMMFSWMIWICYLLSMGTSCFLHVVDDAFRISNVEVESNGSKKRPCVKRGIGGYLWEFLRTFIGQSNLHTQAVIETQSNIDSMRELLEEGKTCLLTQKGALEEIIILSNKGGMYDQIQKRMRSCPVSSILEEDLQSDRTFRMIMNGDYALFISRNTLLYSGIKLCSKYPDAKLHVARKPMYILQKSIAVRLNMDPTLKNAITLLVGRVISSGLMLKWLSDAQGLLPPCFQIDLGSTESEIARGPKSLTNMFLIWVAGTSLSVAIFLCEIVAYYSRGKRSDGKHLNSKPCPP